LEVDNLGADMAIDEKQIGGDFYTILTNRNSGKNRSTRPDHQGERTLPTHSQIWFVRILC